MILEIHLVRCERHKAQVQKKRYAAQDRNVLWDLLHQRQLSLYSELLQDQPRIVIERSCSLVNNKYKNNKSFSLSGGGKMAFTNKIGCHVRF